MNRGGWSGYSVLGWVIGVPVAVMGIFLAYTFFVYAPVTMYTEARCLAAGYPVSKVTIGLEGYCMTLEGGVTVAVDKVENASQP